MMEVATSASMMPAATMVRPITRSLTPSDWAKKTTADTSQSEPSTSSASPAAMSASCTGRRASQASGGLAGFQRRIPPGFAGAARLHHQKPGVGQQQPEQQRAVEQAQRAVQRQHQHQQRCADHDRHLLADQLHMHHQRCDQALRPRMNRHVEDIAAHHIAHGQSRLAIEHRACRHGHFGRAGTEGHNGQPTTSGEMPNDSARREAPRTSRSAPATSATRPARKTSEMGHQEPTEKGDGCAREHPGLWIVGFAAPPQPGAACESCCGPHRAQ